MALYTPDSNSGKAVSQMRTIRDPVSLTSFGELELANALELRIFRRELSATEIRAAHSALREDVESGVYSLKPLPLAVFEKARQMARKHSAQLGTRTRDVLHVASALLLEATEFYTFDRTQGRLAALLGLRTRAR